MPALRNPSGLCPVCGAQTGRAKVYCSGACQTSAYRRRKAAGGYAPVACLWCDARFTPSRASNTYCSRVCSEKAQSRQRNGATRRRQRTQWLYGVSVADVDRMLVEQDGCAICHRTEPTERGWAVDHDHKCCPGKKSCGQCVRGVLCAPCNVSLGLLGDNADTLMAAAAYLLQRENVLVSLTA